MEVNISIRAKNAKPKEMLPVESFNIPITYGPTKPPKLPTELMTPIPTAAVSAATNEEVSAQYGPEKLYKPIVATHIIIIARMGLCDVTNTPTNPKLPTTGPNAAW